MPTKLFSISSFVPSRHSRGFPGGSEVKEPAWNEGDTATFSKYF